MSTRQAMLNSWNYATKCFNEHREAIAEADARDLWGEDEQEKLAAHHSALADQAWLRLAGNDLQSPYGTAMGL